MWPFPTSSSTSSRAESSLSALSHSIRTTALIALAASSSLTSVRAANDVSGLGKYFGTGNEVASVSVSPEKVYSAIQSITDPSKNGLGASASLPVKKIYGVNLGGWLIFESWMAPGQWESMGGQICSGPCSSCRASEWALTKYLGQNMANVAFQAHWDSWFTQADVDQMVSDGLNTVRIPMGYWIIEGLVDRSEEFYAMGGLDQLIRGLTMLKQAGIHVLLDQHAMPGVSAIGQEFAGNCTSTPKFFSSPDDYNYKRGVAWAIIMTWLSHVHPAFSTVFSLEAINEPVQDYSLTPNIGGFEKSFVLGVRAMEAAMGITCDSTFKLSTLNDAITKGAIEIAVPLMETLARNYTLSTAGISALQKVASGSSKADVGGRFASLNRNTCLTTMFMDRDWQYSKTGESIPNPADIARGPQIYDTHLYLSFGGVSKEQTPESYMQTICNLASVAAEARIGDAPLVFGEWAISTNFTTTSDQFLKDYGDAQKMMFSQAAGWIFWAWKVDNDASVPEQAMWSYRDAVNKGVMTTNPAEYFDSSVCKKYT